MAERPPRNAGSDPLRRKPTPGGGPGQPGRLPGALWVLYALLVGVLALLFLQQTPGPARVDVPYSEFKQLVANGQVLEVTLRGHVVDGELHGTLPLGPQGREAGYFRTRVPAMGDERLLPMLEAAEVRLRVVESTGEGHPLGSAFVLMVPWLIFLALVIWLFRRASQGLGDRLGGSGELKRFLESSARQAEVPEVTFNDVAGQENAKRDVAELVDFLKHPEAFTGVGAELPRGVLMMGPPGTGKTLMARALAGEAGVPFYSISGSEFIEVFVGVGASRVRRLFEEAKKHAPSIIFIDELDSIGRTRGTGLGGGHDEREQTLNQILAEMDGFSGHEAVIVLAATNRPDVLDPALLRPGRFDRHLTLDLPDRRDREALLKVHTRKVPLAADVDFAQVAAGTPGFSGADIKNLVNEAALLAVRQGRREVAMADFEESRDKVLLGSVRTLAIQPEERHRLAVHEAGHTLVAWHLPNTDPLYKVSIIPRGRALGGTQQLPLQERHTLEEGYLRDRLALMLAGRAAEREVLGSVSSGADDDIRQATSMARAMVSRWGMAEEVGPIDLASSEEHPFLGREIAQPRRFSEHSAQAVDEAVKALLTDAEARAAELLRQHRVGFDCLVEALEREETLHAEQIAEALNRENFPRPVQKREPGHGRGA
jgi:cell division protease FtsH